MVSQNLPLGIKSSASQILIFGAYVKVRESLYTQVIIWINTTLNHIDARGILPRYEGSCMLYRPEYIENKNIIKYPYATGIKKRQTPDQNWFKHRVLCSQAAFLACAYKGCHCLGIIELFAVLADIESSWSS